MARKLPWTTSANTTKQSALKASSTKRVKTEINVDRKRKQASPSAKSEPAAQSSPIPAVDDPRPRTRNGRSASTSPPPAPPPIELMRPGLDDDDIYMLVEDEFQAIAQSYTAHLHHAEYKRLMKLAKERKAEQQRRGITSIDGERIPDNVTGQTKQHLERKFLCDRQSSGVKGLLGTTLLNDTDDDDEDEAQEAVLAREEKKVGDMWAGTALGGLMTWNHSQERPSLKGLEKVGGETRASKGFGPSAKQVGEKKSTVVDIHSPAQKVKKGQGAEASVSRPSRNITQLDPKPKIDLSQKEPTAERRGKGGEQDLSQREMRRDGLEQPLNKPTRSKFRSLIDSLDDFDDAAFDATQAARHSVSPDKPRSRSSMYADKKEKKDRKDRLDEVPVFLI